LLVRLGNISVKLPVSRTGWETVSNKDPCSQLVWAWGKTQNIQGCQQTDKNNLDISDVGSRVRGIRYGFKSFINTKERKKKMKRK